MIWLLSALAQTPSEADMERATVLYDNGTALYEEGRYEDAIVAFRASFDLSGRSLLLFNIANAEERAGDYASAVETLNRYRVFAGADERETLDQRIRNLTARADEEPDTVPVPVAPEPVVPEPVVPDPVVPEPVVVPTPEVAETPRRGAKRVLGVTLMGVGVAAVGAGVASGVASRRAGTLAKDACLVRDDGFLCPAGASGDLRRNKLLATLANVGIGVGALASAGGVVLVVTQKTELTVGVGHLQLTGRF